jgi:hypothetical protein
MDIRSATDADAEAVQRLRKHAWRARYAHSETGVTQSVLENELAVLPPTDEDIARYRAMLAKPANRGRNLVATVDGRVVGCVTYNRTDEGVGDIGVFVAEGLDGTGVGDAILDQLIAGTDEPLEVAIFAAIRAARSTAVTGSGSTAMSSSTSSAPVSACRSSASDWPVETRRLLSPRASNLALSEAECQESLETPREEAIFPVGTLVGGVPRLNTGSFPSIGGCIT